MSRMSYFLEGQFHKNKRDLILSRSVISNNNQLLVSYVNIKNNMTFLQFTKLDPFLNTKWAAKPVKTVIV